MWTISCHDCFCFLILMELLLLILMVGTTVNFTDLMDKE